MMEQIGIDTRICNSSTGDRNLQVHENYRATQADSHNAGASGRHLPGYGQTMADSLER
jgi:hypothetical protein